MTTTKRLPSTEIVAGSPRVPGHQVAEVVVRITPLHDLAYDSLSHVATAWRQQVDCQGTVWSDARGRHLDLDRVQVLGGRLPESSLHALPRWASEAGWPASDIARLQDAIARR